MVLIFFNIHVLCMSFHHVNYEIIHQHESSSFSSSIDIKMHSLRLFAHFDVLEKETLDSGTASCASLIPKEQKSHKSRQPLSSSVDLRFVMF